MARQSNFPSSLTTHTAIFWALKVQGIFGSGSHTPPAYPSESHLKKSTCWQVCQMQILLIIGEKEMTRWQGSRQCDGTKTRSREIKNGDREKTSREDLRFPLMLWASAGCRQPGRLYLAESWRFLWGPPPGRGGRWRIEIPPVKVLSLKHSRTHTHIHQLSTGKAGDRTRSSSGASRGPNGILLHFDS